MKLKYIAFVTIGAALTLTSCDDYLDKVPDTRVEIETPEQMRMLLVDGYSSSDIAPVLECSGDNIEDTNSADADTGERFTYASYETMQDETFQWEDIKSSLDTNSPSSAWEGYYHAIAVANAALEAAPKIAAKSETYASTIQPYIGEALIIRAYNHFQLANIFCLPYRGPELSKSIPGIPYITAPETKVLVHYERGNLADVYDQIEKDLEEGLPLIDNTTFEQPKYHFNKSAAYAFAARFYLYKRDYEKCEAAATAALGGENSNVSLLMNTLWAQSFSGSSYYAQYNYSVTNPHNFLITATYSRAQRWVSNGRYNVCRNGRAATYRGYGPTWTKKDGTGYVCHPCFAGKIYQYDSNGVRTFFPKQTEVFEYTDKIAGIGYAHIIRTDFTAEETLLCRAEARLFLGKLNDCIADLQIWDDARWKCSVIPKCDQPKLTVERMVAFYTNKDEALGYTPGIAKTIHIDEVCPSDKYSLTADMEPVLQCIQHFRRIETIYDGLRWYDIKRLGLEVTHVYSKDNISLTLTWDDPRKALQIPPDVLSAQFEPNDRIITPSESDEESIHDCVAK